MMEIAFDPVKSERNARERGLPFDRVYDFNFDTAVIRQDVRFAYPEKRLIATGLVENRLHVLCYTPAPNGIRVISFRKANAREVRAMSKRPIEQAIPSEPLTDEEGEVRELTAADFAAMRPASEFLSPEFLEAMRRRRGERGRQKAATKKLVSIRLDQDVIERVKQDGAGWQTRINDILREALFKRTG